MKRDLPQATNRTNRWRRGLAAALLAAAAVGVGWLAWTGLGRLEPPRAEWCELVAPDRATAGEAIDLAVRYRGIDPAARLSMDLHWERRDGAPAGFLSGGGASPEIRGDGEKRFTLPVPPCDDLAFIRAVVYIGPTSRWPDRTRAALSEPIPVAPAGADTDGARRVVQAPYAYATSAYGDGAGGTRPRGGWQAAMIYALYLGAAFLSGACAVKCRRWSGGESRRTERRTERAWLAVAIVLIVAGVFDAMNLGSFLAELGREAARGAGFYVERRIFQRAAVAAIAVAAVAGAILLAAHLRTEKTLLRAAATGAVLLLAMSAARSLSLHGLDRLDRTLAIQLSVSQAAQAGILILVALAALLAGRAPAAQQRGAGGT